MCPAHVFQWKDVTEPVRVKQHSFPHITQPISIEALHDERLACVFSLTSSPTNANERHRIVCPRWSDWQALSLYLDLVGDDSLSGVPLWRSPQSPPLAGTIVFVTAPSPQPQYK